MEQLPRIKLFCEAAVEEIRARLEDSSRLSAVHLDSLRSVLNGDDLAAIEAERFAQCKCARVTCGEAVDKRQKAQLSQLEFVEQTGRLEERHIEFCSRNCWEQATRFRESLDPTPTYLRAAPVAKVLKSAEALGFSAAQMAHLKTLAGDLLAPMQIREETLKAAVPAVAPSKQQLEKVPSAGEAMDMDHGAYDVRELTDWHEDDCNDSVVGIPLIPLIWDILGQYSTSETRRFIASGFEPPEEVTMSEEQEVSNLKGLSMTQRRRQLSQRVGGQLRGLFLESEVDMSESTHVLALVDNLIGTFWISDANPKLASDRPIQYAQPADLFNSSKALRIVAAVFVGIVEPSLFEKVRAEVRGVQAYEWDLLLSVFQE